MIEATKPFTEREAWGLFRLAAFGEAFGWTILILGVAINRYNLTGAKYALPIAGQIHGSLFLIYCGYISQYPTVRNADI